MVYSITRYAAALREVSSDCAQYRVAITHLHRIASAMAQDDHIRTFLSGRSIGTEQHMEALRGALGTAVPAPLLAFLRLLSAHGRFRDLEGIIDAAQQRADAEEHVANVRVTTAIVLPETLRNHLEQTVAGATGRRIAATYAVDPTCIGGVRVVIDETLAWDGTIAGRLERLRTHLDRAVAASSVR